MSETICDDFAEKNFYAIFHLNPRACMIWDMDIKILDWNEAAVNLFGYSVEDVKGKTLFDNILNGLVDADEVIESIHNQLSRSRGGFQNINDNKRKDGEIITCDWYNSPVFDDDEISYWHWHQA